MAFPQQPRLPLGPPAAEGGAYQCDHRKPVEPGHEIIDIAIVRPDHAGSSDASRKRLRIPEKSHSGNQDGAIAGNCSVVRHMDERIAGDLSASNEWHRRAP